MKKLRFGGYELHRIDKYNVGIFRLPVDGEEPPKGNIVKRRSDDGTELYHIGKYYGSYGHAARALHDMLLEQGMDDPAVASAADAIEAAREAFRPVSAAIDGIGREGDALS